MYCDNCGQELREGAKFCPKCGARFSDRNEYTAHMDREVQENDSDSIQNQTENSVSKGKDNKKPKWILYLIIAICAVAALFAAVMFFLTMNSGMTPQKAYKKYYKVLENDKSKVVEFEKEKGANGVAITDINNTGIPDVLYITNNSEDGTDKLYLHTLMDNEKDIEIDMDEELSGSIGESNTIFRIREDSAIYLRNEYGLSRITYSIDDSGTRVILTEILAKRTLDEESGEYVYMILTDSEYLESVSEKEYNKYIDDICSQDVTIIITTLSDEELNKVFPTVDDSIADSCDDAIYKLKNNDITLVGADITEPSDEVASKADQTEAPKEKVGDFVKDDSLVAFDDVLYYVDENGLWKKEHDSDAELLYECSAFNLTTNGQVIYYGVYNETVDYQYYSQTIPTYQYDMYRYDLNNGTNEKLTSFIEAGRPICAVGDIVYYTDYSDDFDGNRAGLSMGLRSYNMSTGEKNYIVDGAHLTAYGNGKIFYRQIMAAGGGFGVHQIYCYDTATGDYEMITDDNAMSFKVVGDKLYYEIRYYEGNSDTSYQTFVRSYDIDTGETDDLFEATEMTQVEDYDDKYIIYKKENTFYRLDIATGGQELLSSEFDGTPYSAMHFGNQTVFLTDFRSSYLYVMDDESMEIVARSDYFDWQSILAVYNNTAYYTYSDNNNYYFKSVKIIELK